MGRVLIVLSLLLSAGCGGQFDALLGYIPTEEELAAYNAQVAALPTIEVRIENHTNGVARVEIETGVAGLGESPLADLSPGGPFGPVESERVLIAAGGTVTGSIKCGDVIGLSIRAPDDGVYYGEGGQAFGLYLGGGNVQLTGDGVDNESFTGDIVSTVRYVRPVEDGVDCETAVLVIQIDTPAVEPVVDEETGRIIQAAVIGTGTMRVE